MADQEMKPAMDEVEQDSPMSGVANGTGEQVEDVEEMDAKSKALMHLLNTSEVCFEYNFCYEDEALTVDHYRRFLWRLWQIR
jgi:hypothetical protein